MTRLSIIRPATAAGRWFGSVCSFDFRSQALCRSAARCSRAKSFGKAAPRFLSSASLARRSAMIWFSSSLFDTLDALLQARRDEIVEVAVEDSLRIAFLDPGAQVLDTRLVEHVGANLVSPLDVGLGGLELVAVGLELAQFELVEARFQHRHGFRAVAVLRAIILALYHDARGQMSDAHRRVGLVDVLAARAGCAVGVDAQIGGIHFHLDVFVHLRIDENAREGGVAAGVPIQKRPSHPGGDARFRGPRPPPAAAPGPWPGAPYCG